MKSRIKIYDAVIVVLFFISFSLAVAIQFRGIQPIPEDISLTIGTAFIGLTFLAIAPVVVLRWQAKRGGSLILGYYVCTALFVMFIVAPLTGNLVSWGVGQNIDSITLIALILVMGFLVWWWDTTSNKEPVD